MGREGRLYSAGQGVTPLAVALEGIEAAEQAVVFSKCHVNATMNTEGGENNNVPICRRWRPIRGQVQLILWAPI